MWAVAAASAFSLSSVVGKDLLDSLGPASLLFWRFSIATVVLWAVVAAWRRMGGPDPLAVPLRTMLGLGVLMGVMVLLGFVALERLDASIYIVLAYMYPMFVVVGSMLLGARPAPFTWLALLVVMVGVVLTVPELFTGVGSISLLGVVLTIAQAIVFASYMILTSRLTPPHVDGVVTAAWTTLGAALVITPIALFDHLEVPRGNGLVAEVMVFALIPTVIATVCFFRSLRHVAPGVVAMVLTFEVALVIVWSILFLGEDVGAVKLLGAAVVTGGVLIAQRVNTREAREVAASLVAAPPSG
jgi:probable blue pigment (indigoidine) exporter